MFIFKEDNKLLYFISNISNSQVKTLGPELLFGRIYDKTGYDQIPNKLFRHLVISRLSFPLSKIKTSEYLYRYQGIEIEVDRINRFMDEFSDQYKSLSYYRTKKLLGGKIGILFYNMTTPYFYALEKDKMRKSSFSKDGNHSNPQDFVGITFNLI